MSDWFLSLKKNLSTTLSNFSGLIYTCNNALNFPVFKRDRDPPSAAFDRDRTDRCCMLHSVMARL